MKLLFNKETVEQLLSAHVKMSEVIAVYLAGSQLYGNDHDSSDLDLTVVTKNQSLQIHESSYSLNVYTSVDFQTLVDQHEISVLEALNAKAQQKIIYQHDFYYQLDLSLLRHSVSEKSNHSFVKAKKKMTVEKDLDMYAGKKSLFHSLRIVSFGIELAKTGKIENLALANHYWKEISSLPDDWEQLRAIYKPMFNSLVSQFRQLAKKD